MIKIVTAEQMRRIDRRTIRQTGVPGVVLMENAGIAVVRQIQARFDTMAGLNASVFAGKGNNGGDGFVVARHLMNLGANVTVFLTASRKDAGGDAKINMTAFENMGGSVKEITQPRHLKNFKIRFAHSAVIVDALLGTGVSSAPRGIVKDVIDAINGLRGYKIAIDMPSGAGSDSGVIPGACLRADVTVTLGLPKVGLVTSPARNFAGRIVIADISIPPGVMADSPCAAYLLESEDIPKILPPRAWDAHKGSFGHLVTACGSRGMSGAAQLAGAGALRMGVGLVTAAAPESVSDGLTAGLPEMMTCPLPETDDGTIAKEAYAKFEKLAGGKTAVLIGPGLSTNASTAAFVKKTVTGVAIPMVVDADGLNCLGGDVAPLKKRKAATVITPHPGEMSRLTGRSTADIQADRIGAASALAKKTGCVVVLKGAGTVIASPEGEVYHNHTGNNGLATGGAGDVLAGMIAGLLAQGVHPEDAAVAGVYIHGECADVYAEKMGTRSLMPGDLLDLAPEVIASLERPDGA